MAKSGAHGLIVLRNSNITLHDKEIDLIHIPIVELEKSVFEKILAEAQKQSNLQNEGERQ